MSKKDPLVITIGDDVRDVKVEKKIAKVGSFFFFLLVCIYGRVGLGAVFFSSKCYRLGFTNA